MRKVIYTKLELERYTFDQLEVLGTVNESLTSLVRGLGSKGEEYPTISDILKRYGGDVVIGPLIQRGRRKNEDNGVTAVYRLKD